MIYRGNKAREILTKNLDDCNYDKCKGYYYGDVLWIAFDNSRGDCWAEEFQTEEMAICWLEGFFEISELDEFGIFKLQKDLFLIPEDGFLKIVYDDNSVMPNFYPV